MGEDEVEAAIAASKAFPDRAWKYLNPENSNTSTKVELLEGLMLEGAVALDPGYTPEKMKGIAHWVKGFEEFVKMSLGQFGLYD